MCLNLHPTEVADANIQGQLSILDYQFKSFKCLDFTVEIQTFLLSKKYLKIQILSIIFKDFLKSVSTERSTLRLLLS